MISESIYYIRWIAIATVVCLAASLILGSCGHGSRALSECLDRAETMIDSVPDQVLTLLTDSACTSLLPHASDEQSARYALLLTQAKFKCYTPPASDSTIAYAVKIFDRKDDEPRLVRALYYLARVQKNAGDYPAAIISAMRAFEMGMNMEDYFWSARSADLISSVFNDTFNYEEALNYSKIAADLYDKKEHEEFFLFSKADEALYYSELHKYDECQKILDSLFSEVVEYTNLRKYLYGIGLSMNLERGDYRKAESFGDSLISLSTSLAQDLSALACVKTALGKETEANDLLTTLSRNLVSQNDSMCYSSALIDYYKSQNKWEEAFYNIEKALTWQNQIALELGKQSAVIAQRDYYSRKGFIAEEKATRNLHVAIFVVVCSVLLILLIYFIVRSYSNKKNEEMSWNMAEIILLNSELQLQRNEKQELRSHIERKDTDLENLYKDLYDKQEANEHLREMINEVLQKHFSHLNHLISEYSELGDDERNYKIFYKNMQQEVVKTVQSDNLESILKIVDDSNDGIISKIRQQIPQLKERDLTFIALMLAGFNARAIGIFTNVHPNSTYRRRKSIIEIIESTDAPDRDVFLKKLGINSKSVD